MFSNFGEQRLERVDNNTPSVKLIDWKKSVKTREAHNELFRNHEILTKITTSVFKSFKNKEIPPLHFAYVLSICDIVLNPKSLSIKCNDKSVLRRVEFLMVNYNVRHNTLQNIKYSQKYRN
jgi:hypothetical protein